MTTNITDARPGAELLRLPTHGPSDSPEIVLTCDWSPVEGEAGELGVPVLFIPELDGFSVVTPSLPGACAQGETIESANANIYSVLTDALRTALATAGEHPFQTVPPRDFDETGWATIIWLDAEHPED